MSLFYSESMCLHCPSLYCMCCASVLSCRSSVSGPVKDEARCILVRDGQTGSSCFGCCAAEVQEVTAEQARCVVRGSTGSCKPSTPAEHVWIMCGSCGRLKKCLTSRILDSVRLASTGVFLNRFLLDPTAPFPANAYQLLGVQAQLMQETTSKMKLCVWSMYEEQQGEVYHHGTTGPRFDRSCANLPAIPRRCAPSLLQLLLSTSLPSLEIWRSCSKLHRRRRP